MDMSNEDIIKEFDDLFGGSEEEPNEAESEETEEAEEAEVGDGPEEIESEETESEETEEEETEEDKGKQSQEEGSKAANAKQNKAFAEMRNRLKSQENLLKSLGKAIGLDEGTSVEDVASKVNEILLKKQSQETGIPEDVLQRLQILEAQAANSQQLERQNKLQEDITGLIEKYDLTQEQVDSFVQQLIENGRNPMDIDGVDIETEYIKNNYQAMMQKAIDDAKAEERERIKKANSQSGSPVGVNPEEGGSDSKITTVKDLDKLFDGMSL